MKEKIRKILLVICVCVFVYSVFQLGMIFYNYYKTEKDSQELVEDYIAEPETKDEDEEIDPLKRVVDFKKLQERNKDVIGWLYIPDTTIDEPILKGASNDTYLRTDIDHQSKTAGQVFIDEINSKDFSDDNTIIYGHNMRNGTRFHDLRYYVEKEFYDEHNLVYIYLPDNTVNVYKIYSANVINASSDFYQKGINYTSYVQNAQSSAKQTSEVSDEQQPLILLSTCYAHNSENRYVVFARLDKNVKIGE